MQVLPLVYVFSVLKLLNLFTCMLSATLNTFTFNCDLDKISIFQAKLLPLVNLCLQLVTVFDIVVDHAVL